MTLDYIMVKYGLPEDYARRATRAQLSEADYRLSEFKVRKMHTEWLKCRIDRDWRPWGSNPDDDINRPAYLQS